MKNLKLFCITLFCLGMILIANNEQRNLSTPLSRLWGHWVSTSDEMPPGQFYFSKVTTPSDWGKIVAVGPDKEEIIKWVKKQEKDGKMTAQEAKKGLAKNLDEIAGKAYYHNYKFISQIPNGIKIIIFRESTEDIKLEYNIDKDGKKMQLVALIIKNKRNPIERIAGFDSPVIYNFVDTKTSPEE